MLEFDTGVSARELEPARPLPVQTPWGTMALFRVGPEIYAVQAFCPHLEGPLFKGSLAGEIVTCPWHQWRYNVQSGERVDLLGRRFGSEASVLVRCGVRVGLTGTVVLSAPADRPVPR